MSSSFTYQLHFALVALFILLSNQICLDPNQAAGECSSCDSSLRLFNGQCCPLIEGCSYYKSGTECLICAAHYVQVGGTCLPSAGQINFQPFQQNNSNTEDLNLQKGSSLNSGTSNIDQKKLNLVWQYLQKNHKQLNGMNSTISSVTQLISTYNWIFLFKCLTTSNQSMQIQAGIDYKDQVIEYTYAKMKSPTSSILDNLTFTQINQFITQKYSADLEYATLFNIQQLVANLFKFHYYSELGQHFVAFVQKSPFLEFKALQKILDQIVPSNIVNFVYSQYPQFLMESNYTVNQLSTSPNLIFQIMFSSQSNLIIKIQDSLYYILLLDKVQQKNYFSSNSSSITSALLLAGNKTNSQPVGVYQNFTDLKDPHFLATMGHLFQEYEYLQSAQIKQIQYQIVSGTNFLINLVEPITNDEYLCKVFYSLSGYINVLQIYRNSILIETQPLSPPKQDGYNYTIDSQFKNLINYLNSTYGIVLPSPYSYVNKIQKSDQSGSYFQNLQIVSNPNTFIIINLYNWSPINITLVEYIVNGESQLQGNLISSQVIGQIEEAIEEYKNWMNPHLVQYIKSTSPKKYMAKIITSQGSFFMSLIQNNSSHFDVIYYELLDDSEFCLTPNIYNTSSSDSIMNLTKLVNNIQIGAFNLSGTTLVTLSEAVSNKNLVYRLLFADLSNFKQIQIKLQYNSEAQIYAVTSSAVLNEGYYHLNNVTLYNQALQKSFTSFFSQLINYKPVLSQQNSTNIRIYLTGYNVTAKGNRTESLLKYTQSLSGENNTIQTVFQQSVGDCTNFDSNGYCSSCSSSKKSFYLHCYDLIKGCQNQVGGICLQCQSVYQLQNNVCVNDCSLLL